VRAIIVPVERTTRARNGRRRGQEVIGCFSLARRSLQQQRIRRRPQIASPYAARTPSYRGVDEFMARTSKAADLKRFYSKWKAAADPQSNTPPRKCGFAA
jgi:hypothetical protein